MSAPYSGVSDFSRTQKVNYNPVTDAIDKELASVNKLGNPVSPELTTRLRHTVVSVDGDTTPGKINSFVNNISLIVDMANTLPIYISLTKKLDNKKIQQKDIKYLIQDAKQQISRSYPEKYIVHIIVKKYIVNDIDYTFVPMDIDCNKISIEIKFICFPKNLIKKIELLFYNFQITIDKIICSNYAKSFIDDSDTKQEVVIVPKKLEKKGFFEKLFHLFR